MKVKMELRGQWLVVCKVMARSKNKSKPDKLGKILFSRFLPHYGLSKHTQEFYEAELDQAYYTAEVWARKNGYKLI